MSDQFGKFNEMFERLIVRAGSLYTEHVGTLPPKARGAWIRINSDMGSAVGMLKLVSDLSYFIGYVEALNDVKGNPHVL